MRYRDGIKAEHEDFSIVSSYLRSFRDTNLESINIVGDTYERKNWKKTIDKLLTGNNLLHDHCN